MCAGVVPQQPPTIEAPAWTSFATCAANSSGPTEKTVRPPSIFGSPAFDFTIIGFVATFARRSTYGSILSGPSPQLNPYASTPSDSRSAATHSTDPPVRSLPSVPSATVAKIGRSHVSFAAMTAAFNSRMSPIVSMTIRSGVEKVVVGSRSRTVEVAILIVSAKAATASSKERSPAGFSSFPVGPISKAILTFLCPTSASDFDFAAMASPLRITSSSECRPWYLRRFAPKVLA